MTDLVPIEPGSTNEMAAWANALRAVIGRQLFPPYLSFSAAETWEQCQRKWSSRYVLFVADPAGPEADIGKMAHTVLEAMGRFKPGRRTIAVAAPIAERAWADKPAEKRRDAIGHVVRALRNLEVSAGDIIRVEMDLLVVLRGVPFKGFIDRADWIPADLDTDAARLIDYKTGKHPGRRDWLTPKFRQLYLYAAAFETITGIPAHQGALVWTKNGRVDTVSITHDEIEMALDWLRDTWREIHQAIQTMTFEPNPGPLCSWCPLAELCPEGQEAIIWRAENEPQKSMGPYGQKFLENRIVDQFAATLEVVEGRHLTIVDDA